MSGCPHDKIQRCPLYVASHYGDGYGCVRDMLDDCEVSAGRMSYQAAIVRAYRAHPELFASCPPAARGRHQ